MAPLLFFASLFSLNPIKEKAGSDYFCWFSLAGLLQAGGQMPPSVDLPVLYEFIALCDYTPPVQTLHEQRIQPIAA
jgi:hypothetical protein